MDQSRFKLALKIGAWGVFWYCLGVYAGRSTIPERVVYRVANQVCELGPTAGEVFCAVREVR